jgi:hypothetical protein
MARIPAYCGACRAIRSVNDWRETTPETLTLILGPCGHHMRRTARVEWSTDRALDRAPAGFLARGRSAPRTPARVAAGGGR